MKGLSCQVCKLGVRSQEFPDFFSEEEGRKWRMCASCVSGLFPSLSVGRVPRSEIIAIGKNSTEFLWELNPRACIAVRTGEEEVWPTAYAAIVAEMFDSEISIRLEIYEAFDAVEVDEILRRAKHKVRSDWKFVRDGVIRNVLKLKVKSHPLLDRLLYTVAGKRVVFSEVDEDVVLGDGSIVSSICMELIDEAASKNHA